MASAPNMQSVMRKPMARNTPSLLGMPGGSTERTPV
jgi:hypothetical protein